MFNLLISGNDESFRGEPWTLERGRVFEHTEANVAAPFRELDQQQLEQLCRFPALIAYEKGVGLNARIARLVRVRLRDNEVRVEYRFIPDLPAITPEQLENLVWELDIRKNELFRTHWALKAVDIFSELLAANVLSPDDYSKVPNDLRILQEVKQPGNQLKISPTVFRVPDQPVEPDLVSVMLPFKPEFNPVFQTIEAVGTGINLDVKNANQVWEESEIIQDIFSLIYRSAIVVCDFSGSNPNVFYEAGIAHTLGKPVVPLAQQKNDLPFDLQHHRAILYLNNEEGRRGMAEELLPRFETLIRRSR
ncbi:MAG TPA: hypothetical protein DCL54_09180 [Alphaproteobacteria bacterium]|nr:hypothetical protein [Alphaproteobacteria bacterium]